MAPDGSRETSVLTATATALPRLEQLRRELADGMALACGNVPLLGEFATGWGRDLLPESVLTAPPDVLVIVPHAVLHDVPLHLVSGADDLLPLGCRSGLCYASSMSLFTRCASRNVERARRDPTAWPPPAPRDRRFVGTSADVLTSREGMFEVLPLMLAEIFSGRTDLLPERPLYRRAGPTRGRLKDVILDEPDVLLLVAHGFVDKADRRMSGLLVHEQSDVGWRVIHLQPGVLSEFRDLPLTAVPAGLRPTAPAEVLTAAELEIGAQLGSELVVLIACSAGAGLVASGDEPVSLAETLLRLGATSVIAAAWDTDYASARDWLAAFFLAWAKWGHPKALAAKYAMQRVHDRAGPQHLERVGALSLRGDWV